MPSFEDYSMKGRTYRYLEKEPLFPFGFGLSYAKVSIDSASSNQTSFDEASKNGLTIKVNVKNESNIAAEEVLQVYVHVNGTRDEVLNTKLASFKRIKLAANESKSIEIPVPAFAFTTVDDKGKRSVTGNGADIFVGFSQPDSRSEALTGTKACKIAI
jgi:beta-glucosidase